MIACVYHNTKHLSQLEHKKPLEQRASDSSNFVEHARFLQPTKKNDEKKQDEKQNLGRNSVFRIRFAENFFVRRYEDAFVCDSAAIERTLFYIGFYSVRLCRWCCRYCYCRCFYCRCTYCRFCYTYCRCFYSRCTYCRFGCCDVLSFGLCSVFISHVHQYQYKHHACTYQANVLFCKRVQL